MKKVPQSVARRYARALLEVAVEKGTAAPVAEQLKAAVALLDSQPELRRALEHPAVAVDKKKAIVAAVWRQEDVLLSRLLQLLVARGRVALLPGLADAFIDLWNEHRGIVAASAVSAVPLAPMQREALAAAARKLAGREVTLETSIDPRLLGGVVLRMSGRTYDGSVRAQLQQLRVRLTSGEASSSAHSAPRN